jgi:hypothetical protein
VPARLKALLAAAKTFGVSFTKPKSGSHWRLTRVGAQRPYPIPAHNGERTEIGDEYIRGMCRALGIDEDELRKLL